MSAQDADRPRRGGAEVDEDCGDRIAQLDEAVVELVLGQDGRGWAVFSAGFAAGYRCGLGAGYRQGLAVLDEAGALLGELRPSQAIEAAAARRRRTEYRTRPLTAEEIRQRAEASWATAERGARRRAG